METINSIPSDILKLQKKLCEYEVDSRNYKKYKKILTKHIKQHAMKRRVNSNIRTIETIQELEKSTDLF
ncbi:hypothetical protein [Poseidonibacter sp.]|uniref:hypothetical protein n=1 Tax=Poseidonibacter sp. TaxID=2321188 RepID=UPI003C78A4C0